MCGWVVIGTVRGGSSREGSGKWALHGMEEFADLADEPVRLKYWIRVSFGFYCSVRSDRVDHVDDDGS